MAGTYMLLERQPHDLLLHSTASVLMQRHFSSRNSGKVVLRLHASVCTCNPSPDLSVCTCRWRPQGNQRAVPVLLACGIQSDVPGDYNITFSVTNSAGLSASTRRRITIKAVCPSGEALCADKVSWHACGASAVKDTARQLHQYIYTFCSMQCTCHLAYGGFTKVNKI